MTKRVISYLLLLAVTVAVLLVVIIQPQKTALQKNKIQEARNFLLAEADEQAAMAAMASACINNKGKWIYETRTCEYPPTTCNGASCTREACAAWGYNFNLETHSCIDASSNSQSENAVAISGISANEQLVQRIESQCLAHVEKSGYGETVKKYGWYNNIRIYATNACTYAYLASNGKYSSNNDLYLVSNLLMNDYAVRQEDIGMLYQALEDVPAQNKGQSLDDYLNPEKDGAAKRLKDIMDIMAAYNDLTTDQKAKPIWLEEPLPLTTKDAAAKWNAQHGTKIVSLQERLLALLPKPEEKIAEQPQEAEKGEITEETVKPVEIATRSAEPEISRLRQTQAIRLLTKIKNLFSEIRDTIITRTKISRSPDAIKRNFIRTEEIISTFTACQKNGVC